MRISSTISSARSSRSERDRGDDTEVCRGRSLPDGRTSCAGRRTAGARALATFARVNARVGGSRDSSAGTDHGPLPVTATAKVATTSPNTSAKLELVLAIRWFAHGREARTRLPFYCDQTRVGPFAVAPDALAAGDESSLFRLFVTLSMYQALRDVVIMNQQRRMLPSSARVVADLRALRGAIGAQRCETLSSTDAFVTGCNVQKRGEAIDCHRHPRMPCHVKDATRIFNRMGDMGKLPTSAWLRIWQAGGIERVLAEVCRDEPSPGLRGALLVERLSRVHRVGRKLATLFVSALSTPALAPGLTPWFPRVDGNELVVVDTNVARAVDALRVPGAPKTYDARAKWVRDQAAQIDLREIARDLPSYSPRLVQQALYAFCSRSNRVARGDPCTGRATPCSACASTICPFALVIVGEGPPGAARSKSRPLTVAKEASESGYRHPRRRE